jgi:NADPH:quinone reductase-like Zn-dependent oxidoreductase
LVEVATLVVDERTAVVRIVAASINPSDIKNIAGAMQRKALPRIPGRDYSCVVEKVRAAARRPTENPAISLVTPADPWS